MITVMPDGKNFRRQFSIIEVFNRTPFTLDELIQDILPDAICIKGELKLKRNLCNQIRVFTRNSLSGYPVNRLMSIYEDLMKSDKKIDIGAIIPFIVNAAKYPLDRYAPETENILHMLQGKPYTVDIESIKKIINSRIAYYFEPLKLKSLLKMSDKEYTEKFEISFDKIKDENISDLFRVYHIVNDKFYAINGKPPDDFNKNPLTLPTIEDREDIINGVYLAGATVTSHVMNELS
jgi:hypothetical protein